MTRVARKPNADKAAQPVTETHQRGTARRAPGEILYAAKEATAHRPYRVVAYRSLDDVAKRASLPTAELAEFLGVSPKTLKRRQEQGVLDESESLKTEMLHKSMTEAVRVFGDEGKAQRWMSRPIVSLDGRRPIDCLDSIEGYERVRETLTKIEYGMY